MTPWASQRIAFIGGGNMACALIAGLLKKGVPASAIRVADCSESQCERVASRFQVFASPSSREVLHQARTVVWAVKPQVLQVAMQDNADFAGTALHLSIAAGVRLPRLVAWLGSGRVIRAMPNTSALVSAGVTGLLAAPAVTPAERKAAERILKCAGEVFWVDSDDAMDAVTAVSGSGPAYFFHFLEAFQRAAEALGFAEARSRELALLVAAGALKQAAAGTETFGALRQRVTSKGGTTEAALSVLERLQTREALIQAVGAAASRSRVLAR